MPPLYCIRSQVAREMRLSNMVCRLLLCRNRYIFLSWVEKHFLEAAALARNSKHDVTGIVINAFSDPFVIPKDMFDLIDGMPSSIEEQNADDVKGDLKHGE